MLFRSSRVTQWHEPHLLVGFEDASCFPGVDVGVSVAALHCSLRLCVGAPADTLAAAPTPRLHAGFSMANKREDTVVLDPFEAGIIEDSAQLGVTERQPSLEQEQKNATGIPAEYINAVYGSVSNTS